MVLTTCLNVILVNLEILVTLELLLPECDLVHFWRQHLRAKALVAALHGSCMLALALCGGLLIELARTQIGEQARLFNGTFEAAQCDVKRLVFFQFYQH